MRFPPNPGVASLRLCQTVPIGIDRRIIVVPAAPDEAEMDGGHCPGGNGKLVNLFMLPMDKDEIRVYL